MTDANLTLSLRKSGAVCLRRRGDSEPRRWARFGLALLLSISLFAGYATLAQEPERKILKKVAPEYPAILKEKRIGGTVRLRVTVEANGEVSNVTVLGGNAILADKAEVAVKQWRFAQSSQATLTEVKINFDPHWE